jgi:alpha-galactosidase
MQLHEASITVKSANVNFISRDLSPTDLTSPSWQKSEALIINKLWNGQAAPDTRHAVVRMLWSDAALYVRFDCRQREPLFLNDNPQTAEKTMQLWEHDVCELFLAPDRDEPRRYAEFEIAPTGEWLDLMVDWRNEEPRDWDYAPRMEAFARVGPELVVMAVKIPWTAFDRPPDAGEVWTGNLFRQVASGETRGYLAWSPTMTAEPQFHVPERFGEFVFKA